MTDKHTNDFRQIAHRASAWVREEVVYLRALVELRRLDDRDLDDMNLGRGDLPGLARQHARASVRHA